MAKAKPTAIEAVVIIVLCLCIAFALKTSFSSYCDLKFNKTYATYLAKMRERHEEWMIQYGRVYRDSEEKESGFHIFRENVEFIDSFNKIGTHSYKLAVNKFADVRYEEFRFDWNKWIRYYHKKLKPRVFYIGKRAPSSAPSSVFRYENVTAVPASVDWREKGAVTGVKNQGECGMYTEHTCIAIFVFFPFFLL